MLFDLIMLLRYHRIVFFLHVWLELIFNLRDEGNVNIAYGEWKWKFLSSFIGYIIIAARLGNNSGLIDLRADPENNDVTGLGLTAPAYIFYVGLISNIVLYPWIFYMFRRQRKATLFEAKKEENEDEAMLMHYALEDSAKLEGMRTFDNQDDITKTSSLGKGYFGAGMKGMTNWFR